MRIVSLCPSLTELVHDLGAADAVVGRTKFCIHPAPWVDGIERVGGTKNPNVARIVALAPDLVLMNEEENRREDAQALRAAGLAVHTSMPRTPWETAQMVRDIADAIGRAEAGARIAGDIEQRATRVQRSAAGRPVVSYGYVIWREPWMTVNDDTFIAAMLALAGGRNAFGARDERYPAFTLDELRLAAPDVVFLASEPFPFAERHVAELAEATGWPPSRFALVDGELLSWHGSRTPAGIDYAESIVERARASAGAR
ncbi:MAG TPA: helical backbone metal receptor [Gemmatimonadaceae bacterium]|nr:helical backbone metal receptor [Gemmatimonadaceae bacterium]